MQILALAAVFAGGMLVLENLGASRRVRIAITVLFAFLPLNGFYAVTLWKDIPYSICLLWSTVALIRIAESGGAWLRRSLNLATLFAGLGMAWLFRHNGILPALAVIGGLLLLAAGNRRRIAIGGVLCAAAVLLVNGPLKESMHVRYEPTLELMMVHTLGAVMSHRNADVTRDEREFLERILPREAWEKHYDPYSNCPLIFNPHYPPDLAFVAAHSRELYRIFPHILARNKELILRHMIRVSSLVWRIAEPRGGYTYVVEPGVVTNDLGLRTESILPGAERLLARMHLFLSKPSVSWLAYRPAIWMYAGFVIFCLVLRQHPGKLRVLVFFPVAFNIIGIWLTVPSQDVRYLYPSILITPMLFGYWRALASGRLVAPSEIGDGK